MELPSRQATAFHDSRLTNREATVDVRNVQKLFKAPLLKRIFGGSRGVHALQGVDLAVYRGEIFGLLGPNGAGKSTLVKILLGLVRPTAMEGSLLGAPVGRRQTMSRVGYLPEQHRFPPYLTGRQIIEFFSALAGLPRRQRQERAAVLIDRVGMTAAAQRRVGTYSKGMRQRIGLAQALASSPELIILDEPTDGVDPVARRDIRDVLVEARSTGASVLVNSHLLGELELICDRVAILVNGKVARHGTIDELALGNEFFEVELLRSIPYPDLGKLLGIIWEGPPPMPVPGQPSMLPGQTSQTTGAAPMPLNYRTAPRFTPGIVSPHLVRGKRSFDGRTLPVTYDPMWRSLRLETVEIEPATEVLDALRAAGELIRRFTPVRPTLEDLFFSTVTNPDGTITPPQ